MTYSTGGPGYPGAQHSGAYAPTTQHAKEDGPSKLPVYLLAAVAVLSLAAYLLSFGPVWERGASGAGATSLAIIAILFAGLFAVIALLPKQGSYTAVVTATAAVGFLLVIWDLIENAGASGWALIAIVVVSALQTIAAVGALLLETGVITPPAPRPKYDPYQQYGGGYYGQPQLGGPQHSASQPPPSSQPTQTIRQPGYPQYGGYPGPGQGPSTGGFSAQGRDSSPPTPPTGFPTYAQPPSPPPAHEQQQPPPHEARTQQVPIPDQSSPSGPPPS
jgi:hypothetical protein